MFKRIRVTKDLKALHAHLGSWHLVDCVAGKMFKAEVGEYSYEAGLARFLIAALVVGSRLTPVELPANLYSVCAVEWSPVYGPLDRLAPKNVVAVSKCRRFRIVVDCFAGFRCEAYTVNGWDWLGRACKSIGPAKRNATERLHKKFQKLPTQAPSIAVMCDGGARVTTKAM